MNEGVEDFKYTAKFTKSPEKYYVADIDIQNREGSHLYNLRVVVENDGYDFTSYLVWDVAPGLKRLENLRSFGMYNIPDEIYHILVECATTP